MHQQDLDRNHPLFHLREANVEFISARIPVIGPKREKLMYDIRHLINKHDLFHCLSSYLPAFGLRIPSIVTIHDLKYLMFPYLLGSRLKALYYKWIIRRGISNASFIVAVSVSTKRDIKRLGVEEERICVVHEAPTISGVIRGELPSCLRFKRYFLCVGEYRPHKNIERITKAYLAVRQRLGDSSPLMVLVGSRYEARGDMFAVDGIRVLGPMDEDRLAVLYANALALVYPSLYEGFGLPIVEAMLLGTPVITSRCSSMEEVAGSAAVLVNPYDIEQIASAMVNIAMSKKLRVELRSRGSARVRLFSWRAAASKIHDIYDQIIRSGK